MKPNLGLILRSLTRQLARGARLLAIVLVGLGLLVAAGLLIMYFDKTLDLYADARSAKATQSVPEGVTDAARGTSLLTPRERSSRKREPLSDDCNITLTYAVEECTKKIKSGRGDASVYLARAQAFIDLGDYDKAIADCDEALRIKAGLVDALLLRGAARQHKGDYQNAVNDYTEGLRVEPNDVEALTKRGSALASLGRFDDALDDLNIAIDAGMKLLSLTNLGDGKADIPIEIARAYYNRGLIWKIKGDPTKAVDDYLKAVSANPADPNRKLTSSPSLAGKTTREKADIFFKEVQFSPDRYTSDWHQIVVDVQPTRFGDLVLARMLDEAYPSTILHNGREEGRMPVVLTRIVGVYKLDRTDVVLIGVNSGGSDPEYSLSFLILKAPDKAVSVTQVGFFADSYDSIDVAVDSDKRVLVNIGCREGRRFVAMLKDEKVDVRPLTSDDDPMAELECEKAPTGGPGMFQ